jgi:hypothetical protein
VVDALWVEADDEAKLRASAHLTRVASEWSGQSLEPDAPLPNWRAVAKSLDFAVAALLGREGVSPYQALSFRAEPLFVETVRPLIEVDWVYRPLKATSVQLFVDPGRLVSLTVDQSSSYKTRLPDGLAETLHEAGLELMDFEISIVPPEEGAIDYAAPILFGEGGENRVRRLAESSNGEAATVGEYVLQYAAGNRMFNSAFAPLIQQAKSLTEGEADLRETVFASAEGFSGFFPLEAANPPKLLVLRADSWLPPQFFLQAAGNGMVLDLARKRGWAIVMSPSDRSPAEAAAWAQPRIGEPRQVLFAALGAASQGVEANEVDAAALLAPVRYQAALADDPERLFVAFGELHDPLLGTLKEDYQELGATMKTYPNCSYLMLPAEAWSDVFAFFDQIVDAN